MSCKIVLKSELEIPVIAFSCYNGVKNVRINDSRHRIDDFNFVFTCRSGSGNFVLSLDVENTAGVPFTGIWTCNLSDGTSKVAYLWGYNSLTFNKPRWLGDSDFLKVSSVVNITYSPITYLPIINPPVENDLKETTMLEDESFKDFTICVGSEAISVHKCFLAFSSLEFKKMLELCKESQDIVIEDFDSDTVKAVVNLMYTRKLDDDLSIEILLNMAKFADKFDLIDAKKIVAQLEKKLSFETVVEISKLSKVISLDELYNKCIDYFIKDLEANPKTIDIIDRFDAQFMVDVFKKKMRSK